VYEDYNLFFGNTITRTGTITQGGHSLAGDPAFLNPTSDDYHLTAASSAIDHGVDSGVTTDLDGNPRPRGSGFDIGTYEYQPLLPLCYSQIGTGVTFSSTDASAVQSAVDSANPGDTIKVAGYCAGIQSREGTTQTVYISKTLTVQGGYTVTNWITPYPITQPTTLDAQELGRVLYITGDISPTIEGLHVTGGNAAGLSGDPWVKDTGGGIFVASATATINNNYVFSNTAMLGGGLYLSYSSATLNRNSIASNATHNTPDGDGRGGGLFLDHSPATLTENIVMSNTANQAGGGLLSFE
jgi:hypothetical protein